MNLRKLMKQKSKLFIFLDICICIDAVWHNIINNKKLLFIYKTNIFVCKGVHKDATKKR